MKKTIFIMAALFLTGNAWTQSGYINSFAGDGTASYGGDGSAATSAMLDYPDELTFDATGRLYIADNNNNVIRRVNTSGIISTFAGNGVQGFSGDGGHATAAEFYYPARVAVDGAGNTYIADQKNNRIRKVNSSGIVTTIAGNGVAALSGDGGPASAAELNGPIGIVLDASGNIYIADVKNYEVREITTSGTIKAFAGTGTSGGTGDGGPATSAAINGVIDINFDTHGNLFLADAFNEKIRKVNTSGTISTVVGNGWQGYTGDGGAATSAELFAPTDVYVDASDNLFIADYGNNVVRKVNGTSGKISTIAGNGMMGYSGDGGLATAAEFNAPTAVIKNSAGDIFIADQKNNRVRKINALTGILEIEDNNSVSVYPNPSNSTINFTCSDDFKKAQIEITDVSGRILLSESREIKSNIINAYNISNFANGVYFVKISTENASWLGKFIKQ